MSAKKPPSEKIGNIAPFGLRMQPEFKQLVEASASASQRSLNAEIVHRLGLSITEDEMIIRDGDNIEDLPPKEQAARLAATFGRFLLKGARDRDFASPDELKIFIADMLYEYEIPLEDLSSEGAVLVNLGDALAKVLSSEAENRGRSIEDEIKARLASSIKDDQPVSSELSEHIKELVRSQRRSQFLIDKMLEALSSNDVMLDLTKIAKEMPEELKYRAPK